MLITAERDGYFGLRAKPALGSSAAIDCPDNEEARHFGNAGLLDAHQSHE